MAGDTITLDDFSVFNELDFRRADPNADSVPGSFEIKAKYTVHGVKGTAKRSQHVLGPWALLRQIADLLEAEAAGQFAPDKMH
jgi:hypothetical protein